MWFLRLPLPLLWLLLLVASRSGSAAGLLH
jgi:hypothetical protein